MTSDQTYIVVGASPWHGEGFYAERGIEVALDDGELAPDEKGSAA